VTLTATSPASIIPLIAQATEATREEIKQGWGGLIVMGCFFLALIFVGIWWIKRS
jgi:hypothetical protein